MTQPTPRPKLGIISDETGSSLDACIALCREEGLEHVEIRMVDGIAPLSLTEPQIQDANRRIRDAGLFVTGIATPLLKWEAPGKIAADLGDQFGFSREGRSDEQLIEASVKCADLFETNNLRIFSYLTHEGFVMDDLRPAFDELLEYAERHDKTLRLENEPVCNIARMDELAEIIEIYDTPRLEPLPDIGNSAQIGEFPGEDIFARVLPRANHIHFKDWSPDAGKFVALGSGVVRLDEYLSAISAAANSRQLTFSLECHIHDDPMAGSTASARHLRATTARHFA